MDRGSLLDRRRGKPVRSGGESCGAANDLRATCRSYCGGGRRPLRLSASSDDFLRSLWIVFVSSCASFVDDCPGDLFANSCFHECIRRRLETIQMAVRFFRSILNFLVSRYALDYRRAICSH